MIAAPTPPRTLFVNAFVAALLGPSIQVLLHEAVHWLTGRALGLRASLFPFGVSYEPEPHGLPAAITAASAVVFSLVVGVICVFWLPLRRRGGFPHLLWLWFAFSSAMEGIGYLETTRFGAGDMASVVRELALPAWVPFVFLAVGIAGQFWLAARFAPHIRRYCGTDRTAARALALWPWLATIPLNALTTIAWFGLSHMTLTPGETILILTAGMATSLFAPMGFIFLSRRSDAPEPARLPSVPVWGLAAWIALLLLNCLLTRGITI